MSSDLELKMRMRRVFWALGYYPRLEVDLSVLRYGDVFRHQPLTDVDVLGISVDDLLRVGYHVADCKSGRKESAVGRAFWLRGVMDYLEAGSGYLVKPRISANAREAARRLGIALLDDRNLARLEASLRLPPRELLIFDGAMHSRLSTELVRLADDLRPLYTYVRYRYWVEDDSRNVLNMIALGAKCRHAVDLSNTVHAFVVLEMVSLFALSLTRVGGAIMASGAQEVVHAVRRYVFGGDSSLRERESLLRVISSLAEERESGRPLELELDPPYLGDLAEVVNRLVKRPEEAREILRCAAVVLYDVKLAGRAHMPDAPEVVVSDVTLKLYKDVLQLYLKATGMGAGPLQGIFDL